MLYHGDLFDVLPTLEPDSIDACVTDAPYELAFMGKHWDKSGVAFQVATWESIYRVLKPGAYLVAFGGTRTYHRMTCAIEDAGFEIRDCLCWLYGSGFPKSLDVSKAIDKAAGAERETNRVATRKGNAERLGEGNQGATYGDSHGGFTTISDPITYAAKQWEGWGTALKPAFEPIVLARKPLIGTVAENVLKHGTGAINIDACRIGTEGGTSGADAGPSNGIYGNGLNGSFGRPIPGLGRWPANVLLDELAAEMLDEQSGDVGGGFGVRGSGSLDGRTSYAMPGQGQTVGFGDSGGASRFFYVAKPSREERDAGIYERHWLNTSEIVYNEAAWVDAALSQKLQVDTATLRERAIEGSTTRCKGGSEWSMCWCGSLSTDPYQPAITSIIATDRSSITSQRILNSSRRPHTNGCMAAAFGVMAAGGSLADYAEFQSPWAERTGTSLQKDGRSTDDADIATSVRLWLTSKPENGGGQRVRARNSHPT